VCAPLRRHTDVCARRAASTPERDAGLSEAAALCGRVRGRTLCERHTTAQSVGQFVGQSTGSERYEPPPPPPHPRASPRASLGRGPARAGAGGPHRRLVPLQVPFERAPRAAVALAAAGPGRRRPCSQARPHLAAAGPDEAERGVAVEENVVERGTGPRRAGGGEAEEPVPAGVPGEVAVERGEAPACRAPADWAVIRGGGEAGGEGVGGCLAGLWTVAHRTSLHSLHSLRSLYSLRSLTAWLVLEPGNVTGSVCGWVGALRAVDMSRRRQRRQR
jgi:hypothetical protein